MAEYIFDHYKRCDLRHALKTADEAILQDAIRYLEDDPRTFGSGYVKEMIWKYIKRYSLTSEDITRMELTALQYLECPMSREFKFMCQTLSRIATRGFWQTVEAALLSDNPRVRVNAYCLHSYAYGIYIGERRRLELKELKRRLQCQYRQLGTR